MDIQYYINKQCFINTIQVHFGKMPREGRYPSLPIVYTKGSHFDVGYVTGTTFADRIRRYWHDDENVSQPARALYDTRDGRELCDVLQKKGDHTLSLHPPAFLCLLPRLFYESLLKPFKISKPYSYL